jgi:hypothetical protein
MRPLVGVLGELLLLSALVASLFTVRVSVLATAFLFLIVQVLSGFLIHCPAHYVVGRLLGIRFREIRLGRTTMAKALPPALRRLASFVPVLSLFVYRKTLREAGASRAKAMYLSGVTASIVSEFAFAAAATFCGNFPATLLTWAYALGHLVSDLALSPKSGDVMRARIVANR